MTILANQLLALCQRGALRSRLARLGRSCGLRAGGIMSKGGRFEVAVTFEERRGYVGSAPELCQPVVALSLGGLRRKVEIAMLRDDVIVTLNFDRAARLERDRRRLSGRPRRA